MSKTSDLMDLVREYGQARWSEALSASYYDKVNEKASERDADELLVQIHAAIADLADTAP